MIPFAPPSPAPKGPSPSVLGQARSPVGVAFASTSLTSGVVAVQRGRSGVAAPPEAEGLTSGGAANFAAQLQESLALLPRAKAEQGSDTARGPAANSQVSVPQDMAEQAGPDLVVAPVSALREPALSPKAQSGKSLPLAGTALPPIADPESSAPSTLRLENDPASHALNRPLAPNEALSAQVAVPPDARRDQIQESFARADTQPGIDGFAPGASSMRDLADVEPPEQERAPEAEDAPTSLPLREFPVRAPATSVRQEPETRSAETIAAQAAAPFGPRFDDIRLATVGKDPDPLVSLEPVQSRAPAPQGGVIAQPSQLALVPSRDSSPAEKASQPPSLLQRAETASQWARHQAKVDPQLALGATLEQPAIPPATTAATPGASVRPEAQRTAPTGAPPANEPVPPAAKANQPGQPASPVRMAAGFVTPKPTIQRVSVAEAPVAIPSSPRDSQLADRAKLAFPVAPERAPLAALTEAVVKAEAENPAAAKSASLHAPLASAPASANPSNLTASPLPSPAPLAATVPSASPPSAIASNAPATPPPTAIEQFVDQVADAREAGRTARPELTLRHAEFGTVGLRIDAGTNANIGDWRATLVARDPSFVPAVQAALAERAVAATASESGLTQNGSTPQRGSENSSQNSQSGGSNSGWGSAASGHSGGAAGGQEQRYGSSTGGSQGSAKPYSGEEVSGGSNPAASDTRDAVEPARASDGALFA